METRKQCFRMRLGFGLCVAALAVFMLLPAGQAGADVLIDHFDNDMAQIDVFAALVPPPPPGTDTGQHSGSAYPNPWLGQNFLSR